MSIQGYNQNGWWFTGGTSFMSNGYVIYTKGLDDEPPNPFAIKQGLTYIHRMFDVRSTDKRASYHKFTSYLKQIADKAAANEQKYLQLKLNQLRQTEIDVNWLDKIEEAIEQQDYSSAYTLLLRRDKDLQKFQAELASNRNRSLQKTNEFFNSQFYKFISQKFLEQLKGQSGFRRNLSLDVDFTQLVDEFLQDVIKVNINDPSLSYIRESFITDLQRLANENNGKIKVSITRNKEKHSIRVTGTNKTFATSDIITKTGNYRKASVLADKIAYKLMENIGRGLSTEAYAIGAFGDIGSRAFGSGHVRKDIVNNFTNGIDRNQQGKNDIIIPEVFGATFSTDSILSAVYADGYIESQSQFYSEIERRMKEAAAQTSTDSFFEIFVNVKGYMSNYNLQIEGVGSFSNRMSSIKALNLAGNMTDRLIFMLNNTVKGCIADDRIEELQDYLAAVCVNWMWDNSDEIFDLNLRQPANFHKIYLFNSGGAYLTASQILKQTLQNLILYGENNNRFVKVGIVPPSPYKDYSELKQKYSVNGIKTKDAWQAILKQRWDEIKRQTMETGTLSIHFEQKALDELLGNLRAIMKI